MDNLTELWKALGTMPDVVSSVADFTNVYWKDQDRKNTKQAEMDLKEQQLDLQKWQQETFDSFLKDPNYEDFEQKWQQAFDTKKAEYNTDDGTGKNYKNNYTAELGNEMFDKLQVEGAMEIKKLQEQKFREHQNIVDEKVVNSILENGYTIKNFQSIQKIREEQYKEGRITESQYVESLDSAMNQIFLQKAGLDVDNYLKGHPNATMEDINSFLDGLNTGNGVNQEDGIKRTGAESYRYSPDHAAIKAAVKKNTLQKISDMQKSNNAAIHRGNTQILENVMFGTKSGAELIGDIERQIQIIQNTTDMQLSPEDRRVRVRELMSVLDSMGPDQEASGGNGGPRTKGIALAGSRAARAYGDIEEPYDQSLYIEMGATGTGNAQLGLDDMWTAWDGYKGAMYDFIHDKYGDIYDNDTIDLMIMHDFEKEALARIKEKGSKTGFIADAAWANMQRAIQDVFKKDTPEFEIMKSECGIFFMDLLWGTDWGSASAEELTDRCQKFVNTMTAKELSIQMNSDKFSKDFGRGDPDEKLAKSLFELENNPDLLWTDSEESIKGDKNAYANVTQHIIPRQLNILVSLLGVDKDDIKVHETKVNEKESHDLNLMPTYETKDELIEFISVDEDTYNIKRTNKKTNEVTIDTMDSIKLQRQNRKDVDKFKNKVNQKNLEKEAERKKEMERQREDQDIKTKDAMITRNDAPPGLTPEEQELWNSAYYDPSLSDDMQQMSMSNIRGIKTELMTLSERRNKDAYNNWMNNESLNPL